MIYHPLIMHVGILLVFLIYLRLILILIVFYVTSSANMTTGQQFKAAFVLSLLSFMFNCQIASFFTIRNTECHLNEK